VVKFLGAVRHLDLPAVYGAADAFMLSSHYEGFGRVILEAQLAGLPVVSTRCCGPEDLIADEETGVLVPATASPAELADVVCGFLEDRERAILLGQRARARAEVLFNRDDLATRLVRLWIKTVRDPAPSQMDRGIVRRAVDAPSMDRTSVRDDRRG
jgi:glycosyltransferase involved in cell wall biosynthesis